ncbi:MAG: hypothetical protein VX899_16040 [Myxococcota bacterium]|nr:hypothetical protein [Myxococcota bacterium]
MLLLNLLGCMALADISGGAVVPMGKPEDAAVAVDLRYDPFSVDNSLRHEQWEYPVVVGTSLRSKYAQDFTSFALGPEACIGAVRPQARVLPVLCAGSSVVQLEWMDQSFVPGIGSPYIEPAVGLRYGDKTAPKWLRNAPRTVILSAQLEYMTRFGEPNVPYLGVQVGVGPWLWMHSEDAERALQECVGPCTASF